MKHYLLTPLLPLLLFWVTPSCSPHKETYMSEVGEVFHTIYHIKYQSDQAERELIQEAFDAINYSANPFDSTSLLWGINNNRTDTLNAGLMELYVAAQEYAQLTRGAYDVTVAPLVNAWGFGFAPSPWVNGEVPIQAVDSILEFVGHDKLLLEGNVLHKKDPRIQLDFASIAKGMACDYIARAFDQKGIINYMVEVGGEIAYQGVNPEGKPWRLGINKPILDSLGLEHYQNYQAIINLPSSRGGVATSGNYRNFKMRSDGTLYAHTIDPRSGYPIQSDVLSATIIAPECYQADALATAAMVLGSEQAVTVLNSIEGVEYMLIIASEDAQNPYRIVESKAFPQDISVPVNPSQS